MTRALDATKTNGVISLDLELVYGHCWGPGPLAKEGVFHVDATHIPRRR